MKKFIYLLTFVVITTIASSCTEENIQPRNTDGTSQQGKF